MKRVGLLEGSNGKHSTVIESAGDAIVIAKSFPEFKRFIVGPIDPNAGRGRKITCTPLPDSKAIKMRVKGAGAQVFHCFYEATPVRLVEIADEIKRRFEKS